VIARAIYLDGKNGIKFPLDCSIMLLNPTMIGVGQEGRSAKSTVIEEKSKNLLDLTFRLFFAHLLPWGRQFLTQLSAHIWRISAHPPSMAKMV